VSPVIPLPDPLPQPAPPVLLWSLLQLTFLLHVLAMNVVLGGSILALLWRLRRPSADALHRAAIVAVFAKALPVAVAAAVTLGVAPLLFVQVLYGRVFLTSSILMGWLWLAVVPLVVVAYFGAYRLSFRSTAPGTAERAVAVGVTLLFSVVAFLYVSNVTRSLRPGTFVDVYARSGRGLTLNLDDPTLWARYFHIVLGAVAVAALAVAVYGALRRAREPEVGAWAMRAGTVTFALVTAVNVFVGTWLLVSRPKEILIRLVGGDTRAMTLLAAGILLAVAAAGAAPLALGARHPARATRFLAGAVLLTLVAMVLLRDEVRQLALRSTGFEPSSWIRPQWGPMALFAGLLVAAIAVVGWMVVALARGSPPAARGGTAALVLVAALAAGAASLAAEEAGGPRVGSALAEARAASRGSTPGGAAAGGGALVPAATRLARARFDRLVETLDQVVGPSPGARAGVPRKRVIPGQIGGSLPARTAWRATCPLVGPAARCRGDSTAGGKR